MTGGKPLRIAFAGGGSGGHVYPAVAVAHRALEQGAEILYLVTPDGIESRILKGLGLPTATLPAVKLVARNVLSVMPMLAMGVWKARQILQDFKPDVIYGTGGYVAFPTVLAGRTLGIPTAIHEPNTVPGRANWVLSALSDAVVLSHGVTRATFPRMATCLEMGTPLRYVYDRSRAQRTGRTLAILGGSQGARAVNQAVVELYPQLAAIENLRVVHVTGEREYAPIAEAAARLGCPRIEVLPYVEDMESLLYRVDFAISRSGALTLAELVEFEVPAIFIPHEPSVGDHQRKNAMTVVEPGGGEILEQSVLTPQRLLEIVSRFLDPLKLEGYRQRLRQLRKPEAAQRVFSLLEGLASGRKAADCVMGSSSSLTAGGTVAENARPEGHSKFLEHTYESQR